MRVLFCSPYKQESGFVQGGMAVWGANIVRYSMKNNDDIELIPVSFDRKTFANKITNPIQRAWCGFKELSGAIKDARNRMKSGAIDSIHICTSASYSLLKDIILLRYAKKYGVRSFVHFHFGRIPTIIKDGGWEKKLLLKVVQTCDVAITMNNSSYNALTSAGFGNTVNIPNPLSENIINTIETLKGKFYRSPTRLLYVGHVYRAKGVWELVEACKDIPNIELHIVGRISPEAKAELDAISRNDNKRWCFFDGEISHDKVLEEFQKASLFVFPSYSEGFPNVILEAMASLCPIASSDVGAIPEMLDIKHDACGICFKAQSVDEVRCAIKKALDNPSELKNMAEKAHQRVYSLYSMPMVWKQLVSTWHFKPKLNS